MSTRRRVVLATWLRAATALILIATLALGVPWLLLATVGNPVPSEGWSWTQPLTNQALLGLVAVLAWLFWAQMIVCLGVEVTAELRLAAGRSADWMTSIPGTLGGQQHLARLLVHAVIAVGLGTAVAASPPVSAPAHAAAAAPNRHPVGDQPAATATGPAQPVIASPAAVTGSPTRTRTIEVVTGDSLWGLAERYLGSGEAWRSIADLNQGHLMADGVRFTDAASIQPGWQLLVPAPDSPTHPASVTIRPGDTLSGLATREYGDGDLWARIYHANNRQVDDPDRIYPGQVLHIPGNMSATAPTTAPPAADAKHPRASNPPPPDPPAPAAPQSARTPPASQPDDPAASPSGEPSQHTQATSPTPPGHHAGGRDLAAAVLGGGGLLGGGALMVFLAQRRRRFRARRSGRTIRHTPTELVSAERTLRTVGSAGADAATFLDQALRSLSGELARCGGVLPELGAARLGDDALDLMLGSPVNETPPPPWVAHESGARWSLSRTSEVGQPGAVAPYPALVAVGVDARGATWLLDLENAGVLHLCGDPDARRDLARFMAAELALNQWSDDVDVALAGFAPELVGINAARLHHQESCDLADLTKSVRRMHEAGAAMGCDVLGARLDGAGADTWMPKIVFTEQTPHGSPQAMTELLDQMSQTPGRDAAVLVILGDQPVIGGAQILEIDEARQLRLMPWDVVLTANQLTVPDAQTLASLLADQDDEGDQPMPPATGGQPFEEVSDAAGALREQLTQPREGRPPGGSLLRLPDQQYLDTAATTSEDLAALAPTIAGSTRHRVMGLDPSLDADLAAWYDPETRRPRLRVLGPVELRATGERTAEVDRRLAYFTELVAYLAMHEHGVPAEQLADAFAVQKGTIHSRMGSVRKWLGTDEATGNSYLPESSLSASAKARGVPVYEVDALLVDADLFKRLRVRGQARGPDGIDDLVAALRLVDGPVFGQIRPECYGWLAETPVDQYLTAGVVDVAHIIATHALADDDPALAEWASEKAISAAPFEDKPRLDLSAAVAAKGHATEAGRYLTREVLNRSDDKAPPPAPSKRVTDIINNHRHAHQ